MVRSKQRSTTKTGPRPSAEGRVAADRPTPRALGPESRPRPASARWARAAVAVGLAAAIVAVYGQVAGFDFVSWDDPWYVSKNPHVLAGLSWAGTAWAFTTGGDFYWHPLTWLSHQLDVTLFGVNAGGHHATSVILHVANTVLLFALFRRTTGSTWRSALTAALFALHPLRVESVAWVAERKDVLSGLFWMLTIAAYVFYARKPGWRRYALVAAAFAAGLMAKPMIVTLPVVLLLLDVWPLERWEPARGSLARLLFEKLPLLALSLTVAVATVVVQARAGAVGGLGTLSLPYRVSNALVTYLAYLGKMIWPVNLAAFYPYPPDLPPWWLVGLAAIAIAAALFAAVRSVGTRPYVTVGVSWYLVTLLPVSGLFQAGDQLMADRFTYLPSIGVIIAVVWGGADLVAWAVGRLTPQQQWMPRVAAGCVAALAILACAVTSHAQASYWRNSETLWTRALAVTEGNHRAHAGLGEWQAEHGDVASATASYREAVRLAPAGAGYRHALGMILARQGDLPEAARELAEAVRLDPRHAGARVSLGAILAQEGQTAASIAQYREAIALQPVLPIAHANLGLAMLQQGQFDEALRECRDAVRLDPTSAGAHSCEGLALGRLGRPAEAAAAFGEVVKLEPSSEAGYVNLAIALRKANRTAEAIAAFEQALRINPANEAVRAALQELRD